MKEKNPLLSPSKNKFGAPAFDKIKLNDYLPAFYYALEKGKKEVESIANSNKQPTFKNTIAALEFCGEELDNICSIFFNLNEALSNDKMQEIAEVISAKTTEFSLFILLNKNLFKKIKFIWDKREELNLNREDYKLLEKKYYSFIERGANLSDKKKEIYSKYVEQLNLLSLKFGKNVLDATNQFVLNIVQKKDLEGLPDFVIEAAKEEAKIRSLKGWAFTLQGPSYISFLKYSSNRTLREKLWRAYNTRCVGGKFDNTVFIIKILQLRKKVAKILGFKNYGEYVLHNRMAKSVENVDSFLNDLLERAYPYAVRDIKQVEKFAKIKIMPWDYPYWSNKLKEKRYKFSDSFLKPYFKLESVEKAIFLLANKLYGLKFTLQKDIPTYHKEVKVYNVTNSSGKHLALFYVDFFPRDSKRGGAWMTNFREQQIRETKDRKQTELRPFVSIVCNFTKPTKTTPSLLTYSEVETLLHEFGHALHGILAQGKYPSLTGTNVARDFVELPSQILENWGLEEEFLKLWAKHYKTKDNIPKKLLDSLIKAKNFHSGYFCVRQLSFGISDMALHTKVNLDNWKKYNTKDCVKKVLELENKLCKKTQVLPAIKGCNFLTSFNHIFSGGYSAGYYSYKWAEMLEADAFELFKQKGIFNKTIAEKFRKNILSVGGTIDAETAYKNFRGRAAKITPLLKSQGIGTRIKL